MITDDDIPFIQEVVVEAMSIVPAQKTKVCVGPYGQRKELTDYYLFARNRDGHFHECKECIKLQEEDLARIESGA